jgi:parvulin-like peptidyl-prolyl isomerase
VTRGDLLRELEEPAFSIGKGSITNPIKTSMGWHILEVREREERGEPDLDEVRDEVTARYEEERFARLAGEFMARLREKTLETGGLVMGDVPSVFAEAETEP